MKKSGYRTADEVITKLGVPVLAVVPDMTRASGPVNRRRRRRTGLALAVVVVVVTIASVALSWLLS